MVEYIPVYILNYIKLLLYFQVEVSGTSTTETITELYPFTNYTCMLYATTVLNGPETDAITIRTAEQSTSCISLIPLNVLLLNCFPI